MVQKIIVKTRSTKKKPTPTRKRAHGAPASLLADDHKVPRGSVERVFQRLIKLAAIPGATGSPLISTEAFYEANLFQLQQYLKHVLEATADVLGDEARDTLKEKFQSVDWNFV